jgi:predicted hydrocarbon binding protein
MWQIDLCPECWGRQSITPTCHFTVGLLQEFLSWLSGGKIYLVEETSCKAKGDTVCQIRIDQKPLD